VSNVIDLLERLGQDAELRYATSEIMEEALLGTGIEPALREAIFGKDRRALEALLGAEPNVCCAIFREEEEEDEEDKEDKPGEDEKAVLDVAVR
jgi:hypothetical protein